MRTLSVLMPVYNESRTLRTIVRRVLSSPVDMEIELICVNDGSSDDSLEILSELAREDRRIHIVDQPTNTGKGAAIRMAIEHMSGDIGIVQDADLEYDPRDYSKLIGPIRDGIADAVYGSRFTVSEVRRVLFFWHALGNRLLTMLSNMANDLNLTDMETCYKAVRADLLKRLRFTSDRFGFEPEITARLAQWGARIYEVPISYHGRTYAEGKKIGWRDGVEALWLVFKFRFVDTRATNDDSVATRQTIGRAPRFRRWVLSNFDSFVVGSVLEVNAGPGHTTAHLLESTALVATDEDPVHVGTLTRRFGHLENVKIMHHDFMGPTDDRLSGFDTVLILDGLQRTEDPKHLLANLRACLRSGGHALIQVPAQPNLFGPLDHSLGHLRRFHTRDLAELIDSAGLEMIWIKSFNSMGSLVWRLYNAVDKPRLGRLSAMVFNAAIPLAKLFDAVLPTNGLSLLAVAKAP